MKKFLRSKSGRGVKTRGTRAMTLVEMMTAMAVFSFVLIALIYTQMFGLRYDELIQSKLGASEESRRNFDSLTADIRSAKKWLIGNYSGGSMTNFTACGNATAQVGNALELNYSASTNDWSSDTLYYFDTNKYFLCKLTTGATTPLILASNLTNVSTLGMSFHAERYTNTPVTNISSTDIAQDLEYKYVIVTTLEFAQYQYPQTKVGPGNMYDYYRMQFKVCSHCPN